MSKVVIFGKNLVCFLSVFFVVYRKVCTFASAFEKEKVL